MGDFEVDTNGHCFLCTDKASSTVKPEPESSPHLKSAVHSLQYLSRYVKLDMSKVFSEGTDVPPDLLAKVAKARLKVELCEDCLSVNQSFSKLYRELERIELELSSHVSFIHEKLAAKAKEAMTNSRTGVDNTEKFKIAEALREETKQKCLQKLTATSGPTVRIQKWSMKQVIAERRKIEFTPLSQRQKFPVQGGNAVSEDEFRQEASETVNGEHVKQESSGSHFLRDDDGNDYFDNNDVANDDSESEPSPFFDAAVMTCTNINMNEATAASSYSTKTESTAAMFEREDDSYKCKECSKRFSSRDHWHRHYKSIHLKIKYKCNLCGIEFNQKGTYTRHHQSVHMGVKFKCLVCNKTFTRKDELLGHQKRSGCKMGKFAKE